ncbi:uncharacterized protein ACA1_201640 [Acanthamoeba castellanii str. Neff]|uniref:Uncharacterized protein n=1 Tax=Acanthamoeba castellanii (strain ATCC 30010 / Neff) TaxID=1257118 RepID=L8H5Q3_ACACF|nr:uncharacterized protein ACA1_201640 [Acanthamoeba castellanii str. Neff]ELR19796.1 hypothetical protein ACA1_201640 [Acanthamoeba castellanii str. Neff]
MEGAAILSFFVGLGLLLGPMSLPYDSGQHDDTTPYDNLPPAPHDRPPPTLLQEEVGDAKQMARRGERPEVCAAQYRMKSKEFCECIIGRNDNFFCSYECHCLLVHCESSRCHPTHKAIVIMVLLSLFVLGTCLLCCGLGCLAYCWLNQRHQGFTARRYRKMVSSTRLSRRRRRGRRRGAEAEKVKKEEEREEEEEGPPPLPLEEMEEGRRRSSRDEEAAEVEKATPQQESR